MCAHGMPRSLGVLFAHNKTDLAHRATSDYYAVLIPGEPEARDIGGRDRVAVDFVISHHDWSRRVYSNSTTNAPIRVANMAIRISESRMRKMLRVIGAAKGRSSVMGLIWVNSRQLNQIELLVGGAWERRRRAKKAGNRTNSAVSVEFAEISSLKHDLSVRSDHLPREMEFAVMMIGTASKDNCCARQTFSKARDMLHQGFPTRHVRRRTLVNSVLAPSVFEQATALHFKPSGTIGADNRQPGIASAHCQK